VARRCELGLF